jgi:hypothetical protein
MQVFDYNDLTKNATKIFDAALIDEVIINNKNGYSYNILPFKNNESTEKSPLEDIPCIKADITTQ